MLKLTSVFLFIIFFANAWASASEKTLLACNLPTGPDQEFRVIETTDSLVLRELTDYGSWLSRPLSQQEWQAKSFELRADEFGDKMRVSFDADGWIFKSKTSMGYADCD